MAKVASYIKTKGSSVISWAASKVKLTLVDYKEAAKECFIEGKSRPVRSLFYSTLVVGGVYSYYTVPTELDFHGTLNEASNDLLITGDAVTNEESNAHIQRVYNFAAKDRLRYQFLGLFSVVYYSDHGVEDRNFISQCKYSNPRWHQLPNYVVDVGFWGRWWVMQWKMVDYDVNLNEFPLQFESYFHQCSYMVKKAFGTSYFSDLTSQPVVLSHYVDLEAEAKDMVVAE